MLTGRKSGFASPGLSVATDPEPDDSITPPPTVFSPPGPTRRDCVARVEAGTFCDVILLRVCSVAALSLLLACDGGDQTAKKADAKKADAKKPDRKQADAKQADAKKADAKKADAKKADDGKAPAKPGELHLDVSHDKSGILARSAAALETVDAIDTKDLADLSHHAEKLPSVDKVCAHIAEVRKTGDDTTACKKDLEHHVVQLGPELYGEIAACFMAAATPEAIAVCEAAEKEAEQILHDKPHGDGLDKAACDKFFTHFEALAMEDAGDQAELVKEILEDVREDVVTACVEQGTKAELECSNQAKTLHDLKECASKLL